MKKLVILMVVMIVTYGVYAGAKRSFSNEVVATLDGEEITISALNNYVNTILGEKYAKLLETKEGLKQLTDYYITRKILLEEARKTIGSDNELVKGHLPKGSDKDTILLTVLLDREVNKKIVITDDELASFMLKNNITDRTAAFARLESIKRNEIFESYKKEITKRHKITN